MSGYAFWMYVSAYFHVKFVKVTQKLVILTLISSEWHPNTLSNTNQIPEKQINFQSCNMSLQQTSLPDEVASSPHRPIPVRGSNEAVG